MNSYTLSIVFMLTIAVVLSSIYVCLCYQDTHATIVGKKNIFLYWEQGWENATIVCKLCLLSWKKYNPLWNIVILDKYNLHRYIDIEALVPTFWKISPIQSRSDVLRINLLNKYNGLWVDATLFCTKPLDSWIHEYTPFFAFRFHPKFKTTDNRMVSSWFLFSSEPNYIVRKWCTTYNRYWEGRTKPDNYFQFHIIFSNLYDNDPMFKRQWDNTDVIYNRYPHLFKGFKKKMGMGHSKLIKNIRDRQSPVYKLDKTDKPDKTDKRAMSKKRPNPLNYLLRFHGVL